MGKGSWAERPAALFFYVSAIRKMSNEFFNGFAFQKLSDLFKNLCNNEELAGKAAVQLLDSGFFDHLNQRETESLMGAEVIRGSLTSPVRHPDTQEWGFTAVKRMDPWDIPVQACIKREWLGIPSGVHVPVKSIYVSPAHNNQVTRVTCAWPLSIVPQPIDKDLLKWAMDHFDDFGGLGADSIVNIVNSSSAPDGELDLIPGITEFVLQFPNSDEDAEWQRIDSKTLSNFFISEDARKFQS